MPTIPATSQPLPRRRLLQAAALLGSGALALPTRAQTVSGPPLDADEQARFLDALAQELQSRFVFPEVGERYARMLRERARQQAYAAIADRRAFAEAVTADLKAVHEDRHLVVRVHDPAAGAQAAAAMRGALQGLAPLEAARLLGEVAYLKFNLFPQDPAVASAVHGFLTGPAASARAVVIDARTHRGGGLLVMDAMLPLLYPEPRTLVRMDTRPQPPGAPAPPPAASLEPRDAPPTLVRRDHVVRPDPRHTALQRVPVHCLTSRRTASAAEHLALALQSSGRAQLIGEPTAGAGHFGGPSVIGAFSVFVPIGRTYDPRTGEGWEGRGIRPDLEVPAEQALEKSLALLSAQGIRTA